MRKYRIFNATKFGLIGGYLPFMECYFICKKNYIDI